MEVARKQQLQTNKINVNWLHLKWNVEFKVDNKKSHFVFCLCHTIFESKKGPTFLFLINLLNLIPCLSDQHKIFIYNTKTTPTQTKKYINNRLKRMCKNLYYFKNSITYMSVVSLFFFVAYLFIFRSFLGHKKQFFKLGQAQLQKQWSYSIQFP